MIALLHAVELRRNNKTNIIMIYQREPILEPKTETFVDSTRKGWQTLYTLSYAEAREVLEGAQAKEVEKLPADIEDKVFCRSVLLAKFPFHLSA